MSSRGATLGQEARRRTSGSWSTMAHPGTKSGKEKSSPAGTKVERRADRNGRLYVGKTGQWLPIGPEPPYRSGLDLRKLRKAIDEVLAEEKRRAQRSRR